MTPKPSRLSRLLAIVPYFQARDGIQISQAMADLGVTERELYADLNLLFVCGLPGGYGGDLIELNFPFYDDPKDLVEVEFRQGTVRVGFSAGMDRPLRLTRAEATPLLVALRQLVKTPGLVDSAAVDRAIAKIENAVGARVTGVAAAVDTARPDDADSTYATIKSAVRDQRALRLKYYTATSDTTSTRTVDPIAVKVVDNAMYLEAWCREAEDRRLFRFDRVDEAEALDEPSRPRADPESAAVSPVLSQNPDLPVAVIEIDHEALWILDYSSAEPIDDVLAADTKDRPVRARLVFGSVNWLTRFLLGFGGDVRLVRIESPVAGPPPPATADAVTAAMADLAAAARARYA
ncbi:YafY family protein [Gordonia sp. (in: high G+C Gram-positive bacteria)]|jgi:proteasome accessory factor C|uniref:helix-turn-helix transcriptional regulator n=1 Tax=Gordonia sp. (in: high G+C Gram-positive bacteria) TaxID=84139 RepID=UPI001D278B61|nr:WYL domain-containing protein [Gordonia sp. (in: high G+C Gram-positive bacteria)]MCB1294113.1 WYL domain-containing protein [Gordonia sp. (in: high G+C Gram-positive bacteria)]HMS76789.1 WYL domain-containing protein [Gordonia sp. (in: high G+C Gram-positive bacteria)]